MTTKTMLWMGTALALASTPAFADGRGTDGELRITFPQATSTLNPYLSSGTKDVYASSMVLEPLAGFDENGAVYPRLVSEIPSVENGGISADFKSITWKLLPGVKWSDGTPFTAADVVFTGAYCNESDSGCAQAFKFDGIEKIEAVDDMTVKITFTAPKANPFNAFVGSQTPILQKAQFENCMGAAAAACTEQNFAPIGTGPFRVTGFTVNDLVQYEANPEYRDPAKPEFATAIIKGGGDSIASARGVMETGEFDYAWNAQINPELQAQMLAAGKGTFIMGFGTNTERLELNLTDPSPDLAEGERSTAKFPNPRLSDVRVRRALSMAIDRTALNDIGYGAGGSPNCNVVPAPAFYASDNTGCLTQDIEGAKAMLEEAGWIDADGDGVREKDGMPLKLLFQTTNNPVRQDFQALIKGWWAEIGIETELKVIDPGVFFGGDPSSPDTAEKFYADVEMHANNFDGTDPEAYLAALTTDKAPRPETNWIGTNYNRFANPEYDALSAKLAQTFDMNERAAIAKQMNDMITKDGMVTLPLILRGNLSAQSNALGGVKVNAWDSEMWNVADWNRVK
ncbi:MAG: peptide ABC transporter [Rhodobacter sp.]|nr:peptide ABC transporter [Rhodobacter sp.]